jgi:hypothetical protein
MGAPGSPRMGCNRSEFHKRKRKPIANLGPLNRPAWGPVTEPNWPQGPHPEPPVPPYPANGPPSTAETKLATRTLMNLHSSCRGPRNGLCREAPGVWARNGFVRPGTHMCSRGLAGRRPRLRPGQLRAGQFAGPGPVGGRRLSIVDGSRGATRAAAATQRTGAAMGLWRRGGSHSSLQVLCQLSQLQCQLCLCHFTQHTPPRPGCRPAAPAAPPAAPLSLPPPCQPASPRAQVFYVF